MDISIGDRVRYRPAGKVARAFGYDKQDTWATVTGILDDIKSVRMYGESMLSVYPDYLFMEENKSKLDGSIIQTSCVKEVQKLKEIL